MKAWNAPHLKVPVVCAGCGKTFLRYRSKVKEAKTWGRKMYCSSGCVAKGAKRWINDPE